MDDSHICTHCQDCVIQQFVSACQQLEWLLDRVLLGYDVADTTSLYNVLATHDLTTIPDVVILVKSVESVCATAYLSQFQLGPQWWYTLQSRLRIRPSLLIMFKHITWRWRHDMSPHVTTCGRKRRWALRYVLYNHKWVIVTYVNLVNRVFSKITNRSLNNCGRRYLAWRYIMIRSIKQTYMTYWKRSI